MNFIEFFANLVGHEDSLEFWWMNDSEHTGAIGVTGWLRKIDGSVALIERDLTNYKGKHTYPFIALNLEANYIVEIRFPKRPESLKWETL